jgi:adenylate cyclase
MGHVGGGGHFNYRAIGDITNTASRIEGLNKVLGTNLLAAESVVSGLPQVFVRPMGAFLLKGKMNALSLFEIMANDKDATDEQRRLCAQFSRALEVFKQRDWREASRLLAAILKEFPNDRPSRYYLGMCQRYALVPPEHNEAQAIRIETK